MPNPTIDKFQVDNTTYDFIDSTARSTANAAVPQTRTVNSKALSTDVALTAEDIGYDSTATHSSGSIGEAITELSTALDNFSVVNGTYNEFDGSVVAGQYGFAHGENDSRNGNLSSSSYAGYILVPVKSGDILRITTHGSEYVSACNFYTGLPIEHSTFVSAYEYLNTVKDYIAEVVSVPDGVTYAVISTTNTTNYPITIEIFTATKRVKNLYEAGYDLKERFYSYIETADAKRLYLYYRSGEKVVRYELHNVPIAASNSNTWQLGAIYGCTYSNNSISNAVELVTSGEFELAFKEHGAEDFCGGNNHGDENTDSFALFIDGKQITNLSSLSNNDFTSFNRIDAIEIATVNRCNIPNEDIITHQKVWTFDSDGVKVHQSFKFLEELSVDGMFICMLPVKRSAFPYGLRQGSVGIENMSTSDFETKLTTETDMFYEFYGTNETAIVKAKTNNPTGSGLWVNGTDTINKLYFTFYPNSNSATPQTIEANTILTSKSEYVVSYNA